MSAQVPLLCLSLIVAICYSTAEPVSFVSKCKPADSKCIRESAQVALPEFAKVYTADPLHLSKVDASTAGLKLIVTDSDVTGIKDCQIKKFAHDIEAHKFIVKALCGISLEGKYEMTGQLLILPMEGKGPVHANLPKIQLNFELDLEDRVKEGKKHWHIKSIKHTFELKDKSYVEFENLFSGNELLGRTARELIANNGNDIVNEVGPPVIKAVLSDLVKSVNKFFGKVPVEDLVEQ